MYHLNGHEYISQTGSRSNTTKLIMILLYQSILWIYKIYFTEYLFGFL